MENKIIQGDCIEQLKPLEDNSVDAIITDPPYGLGFMNKEWDSPSKHRELVEREMKRSAERKAEGKSPTDAPFSQSVQPGLAIKGAKEGKWYQEWCEQWSKELLRVLKPGGYFLSFCATRMYHRMTCGIEDAGFEIRDTIMWLYGSGFPKSLNVSKQLDKYYGRLGYDLVDIKNRLRKVYNKSGKSYSKIDEECGFRASGYLRIEHRDDDGWGEALPTLEKWDIIKKVINCDEDLGKKFAEYFTQAEREITGKKKTGFFEKNKIFEQDNKGYGDNDETKSLTPEGREWEGWGTALKPACEPIVVARKPLSEKNVALNVLKWGTGGINIDACRVETPDLIQAQTGHKGQPFGSREHKFTPREYQSQGRFPANIILDEEAGKMLDEQSGESNGGKRNNVVTLNYDSTSWGGKKGDTRPRNEHNDKGGASRFFYCAKASKSERNLGCEEFPTVEIDTRTDSGKGSYTEKGLQPGKNNHPTVKPIALMEYLIKLVSKEGATILDPFLGSGTTAIACVKLNRQFIGIEKEEEYIKISKARIKPFLEQRKLI